jgi:hypothetical protein
VPTHSRASRVARSAGTIVLLGETSTHPRPFRQASGKRAVLVRWPPRMNLFATTLLAFSMSADAFAAALGKGASLDRLRLGEALRVGSCSELSRRSRP